MVLGYEDSTDRGASAKAKRLVRRFRAGPPGRCRTGVLGTHAVLFTTAKRHSSLALPYTSSYSFVPPLGG